MATINFYIEKKKNVFDQNIFARCKHGKGEFKHYLSEKISEKEWNPKTQRARGNTTKALQINNHIDTIQSLLSEIARDLKTQAIKNGHKTFEVKDWQDTFTKKIGINTNKQNFILPELFDKFVELKKNTLKKVTKTSYSSAKAMVEAFFKQEKCKKFDYENFYVPFLNFLIKKGLNNSTINLYITKIKTILQYFLDYTDYITDNPKLRLWKNLDVPPEKHIIFSEKQALGLYEIPFSEIKYTFNGKKVTLKSKVVYHKVINSFIFSFFTGLARNEINNMKISNITQRNTLSIIREKTNYVIEIPLNNICLEIIELYGKDKNGEVNTDKNRKIIQKIKVGTNLYNCILEAILKHSKLFEEEVTLTKYVGTEKIEKIVPLWKAITFHSARHSYATHMLGKGLAITDVQKLLGHSNVTMTQRYATVLNDELMERARKILES